MISVPVVSMSSRSLLACALGAILLLTTPLGTSAESSRALILTRALQRALAANPRLTAAERDIGIAAGRRALMMKLFFAA
jgi:cobalt-zinc-cadmium efflux system outer membrane protein